MVDDSNVIGMLKSLYQIYENHHNTEKCTKIAEFEEEYYKIEREKNKLFKEIQDEWDSFAVDF